MDRSKVRAEFERRFTAERMAEAHIAAYRSLLSCGSVSTALDRELMELSMAPRAVSEPSTATWEQLAGKRVAAVLIGRIEEIAQKAKRQMGVLGLEARPQALHTLGIFRSESGQVEN